MTVPLCTLLIVQCNVGYTEAVPTVGGERGEGRGDRGQGRGERGEGRGEGTGERGEGRGSLYRTAILSLP